MFSLKFNRNVTLSFLAVFFSVFSIVPIIGFINQGGIDHTIDPMIFFLCLLTYFTLRTFNSLKDDTAIKLLFACAWFIASLVFLYSYSVISNIILDASLNIDIGMRLEYFAIYGISAKISFVLWLSVIKLLMIDFFIKMKTNNKFIRFFIGDK